MTKVSAPATARGEATYDAFISYSHSADGKFAPALQDGLQRLAKPITKRRAMVVFRDDTNLVANPHLWESIAEALDSSRWYILLLSEGAAQSVWVGKEIEHWLRERDIDHMLPVLTEGELWWDPETNDIDFERSTAAPPALAGVFDEEPRYIDMRWAHKDEHLDLRHSDWRDAVAELAAPIRGVPKDELETEDIRQFRRTTRLRRAAEAALTVLTVAAIVAGIIAVANANRARQERDRAVAAEQIAEDERDRAVAAEQIAEDERDRAVAAEILAEEQRDLAREEAQRAESRALAADGLATLDAEIDLGTLLALEALRVAPTVDALGSVMTAVGTPSSFQRRIPLPGSPIVRDIAWSTDGRHVAAATEFGEVWIWDEAGAEPVIIDVADHAEPQSLVFVDDGAVLRMVTMGTTSDDNSALVAGPGTITDWNAVTGELLDRVTTPAGLHARMSASGSAVAIVVDFETIVVVDHEGATTAEYVLPEEISGFCGLTFADCSVAIDPTGETVAWVDFFDAVWVGVGGGSPQLVAELPDAETAIDFAPGGTVIVGVEGSGIHSLPATSASAATADTEPDFFPTPISEVLSISAGPQRSDDIAVMATAHLNGSVMLWDYDVATGTAFLADELKGHRDEARAVALSPDGTQLVSGGWDGDLISWSGSPTTELGVPVGISQSGYRDVAFVGDQVVALDEDGALFVTAVDDGTGAVESRGELQLSLGADVDALTMAAAPDGRIAAVGLTDGSIVLLDLDDEAELGRVAGHDAEVVSLVFAPSTDPLLLVSAGQQGATSWTIDPMLGQGVAVHEFDVFVDDQAGLAVSPDGATLLTVDDDVVAVWDLASGALLTSIPGNEFATATAVAISSDGRLVAWGDDTRIVSMWDLQNSAQLGEDLTGHRELISDLAFVDFDGDGTEDVLVSTSHDGTMRWWDVSSQRLMGELPIHADDVAALAMYRGWMVTAGEDGRAWLWDLDPEAWVTRACRRAGRNMSLAEWRAVSDDTYVRHCSDLASGRDAPEDAPAWEFTYTGDVD